MRRCTLKGPATFEGVGLFTGHRGAVVITPGASGLRFVQAGVAVPASVTSLLGAAERSPFPTGVAARNTTLVGPRGGMIATVEHVLSAIVGLGVTDAEIEIRGLEVPIMDGSAEPIVDAIAAAGGLVQIEGDARPVMVERPIDVRSAGGATIIAMPRTQPGWSCSYTIDYGGRGGIAEHTVGWDGRAATYQVDVAPARTFCLRTEAEAMRAKGLFAHLTPREMLVLDDASGVPIENTLRFPDEPARHKLLDLIGDLALLGRPLQADVRAERSGHALTHELCRAILAHERTPG